MGRLSKLDRRLKATHYTLADEDSDEDSKNEIIENIGNSIYFHAGVNTKNVFTLLALIKKVNKKVLQDSLDYDFEPEIKLYIQSDGGCAFAGLNCYDKIRKNKIPIKTIADGLVASAATIILLAGYKKEIQPHGSLLIHQLSTGFWGKYEELKDEMKNSEMMMQKIKAIYSKHTSIPKRTLENIIQREMLLPAEECVRLKIVDSYY